MSKVELRKYQCDFFEEINKALPIYQRVIAMLPTGGGKSVVMGCLVKQFIESGKRVLVLSNRTEILSQNFRHIANFGYEAELINPQTKSVPKGSLALAMAQTLHRRVERAEWRKWLQTIDVCVLDEAHEAVSDFVHDLLSPKAEVIGFTATPCRYGNNTKQLGHLYRAIVSSVTVRELMDMGFLAKPKLYSIAAPTLDDCEFNYGKGDYSQKSLAKKYESRRLYANLVQECMRVAPDKKTIVFCVSSKQAIELTEEFNLFGVSAKYILSGSFDSDEVYSGKRSDIMDGFARGDFQVLCNVGVATSGIDVPDIQCVVLNFATVSVSKYRQATGRAARVTPTKKDFIIIDAGENYKRLGRYEDNYQVCLWHDTGNSGGIQALKQCPEDKPDINGKKGCGEFVPMSCKVCPSCGRVFVTEKHAVAMHLEEVAEGDRQNDIAAWAAQKKVEGWKLDRIMIQVCLANPDNAKKAFAYVYKALYEGKTDADVGKYWWQFKKIHGKRLRL